MSISNRWLCIFLILPHLSLYYFNLGQLKPLVFGWQIAVVLIALLLLFKRITVLNVLIFFYMTVVVLSAVINRTLTGGVLFVTVVLIALCIYISHAIKNPIEFFKGMYYLFSMVIVLNFITMLTNGIATDSYGVPTYLLGGKNAISMTVLPAISIVFIYSYVTYKKIRAIPLVIILIGIASIFLSGSGTGVVVAILSILFLVVGKKYLPTLKTYLLIYLIIFFTIVVFRLQNVLFGDFITNVLHKDLTFTGRTYIWDLVLNIIGDSWFLGFGRGTEIISQYFSNLSEAHNGFLEVLLYSGILGTVFFVVILVQVAKKLKYFKNHIISKVLSFFIFAYMIIGLTESVFYKKEFWILLVISYGIGYVVKQTEDNNHQLN